MLGEFHLIARYLAPLASEVPGALELTDDGAVLDDGVHVVTLDTLVAGTHYLPDDPPALVARKALRVNLSDLAAMGARPTGYLLSLALAPAAEEAWVARFTEGLATDQSTYGVHLLGGDTTGTSGPTTLSVTALGRLEPGPPLRRCGARVGDYVYVSGTIGDSAFGLDVARGIAWDMSEADRAALTERYRLPRPRVALGQALCARGLASAAIDVSDGLVADLGHVCAQSDVGMELEVRRIPLSTAAQRVVEVDVAHLVTALTGGDDYELAFTAPPAHAPALGRLARELDLPLTCIGTVVAGKEPVVRDPNGAPMHFDRSGWTHFSDGAQPRQS
jgi:thiamine-monophosphate kinase